MDESVDIISSLPDCLVVEILVRLPSTKYAIRTGILSKRWKHLWTFAHTLIFRECDVHISMRISYSVPVCLSIFNNTITQCQSNKLNKFQLHLDRLQVGFESQVNSLIRYAINRNVQELYLNTWSFKLNDDTTLNNSCCTHLKLAHCVFSPFGVISWNKLKSLHVLFVKLDEDMIQNILSGSPLLETLNLGYCYGYKRLDITSKSVKDLVVSGYDHWSADIACVDIIEINAPNVLSLTLQYTFYLRKLLLLDVSSLRKAYLNFTNIMEPHRYYYQEDLLEELILKLHHVKELKLGKFCIQVLSLLKANGRRLPWGFKYITARD